MFRAICSFTILFIVALPLRAADEVKPNTLTPKEVEEGWILLFDGETTFGWTSKDGEKIAVEKGEITFPAEGDVSLRTTSSWSSFQLRFDYRLRKKGGGFILLGYNMEGTKAARAESLGAYVDDDWERATVSVEPGKYSIKMETVDPTLSDTFAMRADRRTLPPGAIAFRGPGAR